MGSVFHKTITRKILLSATIKGRGKNRVARWKSGSKWVEAPIVSRPDGDMVRIKSLTYYAKYRDAHGLVVVVPTKCKDRGNAEQVLSQLEREADRIRAGIGTHDEFRLSKHKATDIDHHVKDYVAIMIGSETHRVDTERCIRKLIQDCGWSTLADMKREHLEMWLAAEARK
jgi:hypothetical protein